MKKMLFAGLVLFAGTMFFGCATVSIPEGFLVDIDPNNPFQGTWVSTGSAAYIHVINGMNGEWYAYGGVYVKTWSKQAVYTIKSNNNKGYITSNDWPISITKINNVDILTVGNMTYERYVKK